MMLQWDKIPSLFSDMDGYGSIKLPFQYIVTYDKMYNSFAAPVKRFPNAGAIIELGHDFRNLDEAKQACEYHYKSRL